MPIRQKVSVFLLQEATVFTFRYWLEDHLDYRPKQRARLQKVGVFTEGLRNVSGPGHVGGPVVWKLPLAPPICAAAPHTWSPASHWALS